MSDRFTKSKNSHKGKIKHITNSQNESFGVEINMNSSNVMNGLRRSKRLSNKKKNGRKVKPNIGERKKKFVKRKIKVNKKRIKNSPKKCDRPPKIVMFYVRTETEEDLLRSVNCKRDYIHPRCEKTPQPKFNPYEYTKPQSSFNWNTGDNDFGSLNQPFGFGGSNHSHNDVMNDGIGDFIENGSDFFLENEKLPGVNKLFDDNSFTDEFNTVKLMSDSSVHFKSVLKSDNGDSEFGDFEKTRIEELFPGLNS